VSILVPFKVVQTRSEGCHNCLFLHTVRQSFYAANKRIDPRQSSLSSYSRSYIILAHVHFNGFENVPLSSLALLPLLQTMFPSPFLVKKGSWDCCLSVSYSGIYFSTPPFRLWMGLPPPSTGGTSLKLFADPCDGILAPA